MIKRRTIILSIFGIGSQLNCLLFLLSFINFINTVNSFSVKLLAFISMLSYNMIWHHQFFLNYKDYMPLIFVNIRFLVQYTKLTLYSSFSSYFVDLLNYARLSRKPLLFRSFTGLELDEFDSIY